MFHSIKQEFSKESKLNCIVYFYDSTYYIFRNIVAFQLLKKQRLSLFPFFIYKVPFKSFVVILLSIYI